VARHARDLHGLAVRQSRVRDRDRTVAVVGAVVTRDLHARDLQVAGARGRGRMPRHERKGERAQTERGDEEGRPAADGCGRRAHGIDTSLTSTALVLSATYSGSVDSAAALSGASSISQTVWSPLTHEESTSLWRTGLVNPRHAGNAVRHSSGACRWHSMNIATRRSSEARGARASG